MNNKKLIRLTESDIHNIVKESVNKVLNEISDELRQRYINGRKRQFNSIYPNMNQSNYDMHQAKNAKGYYQKGVDMVKNMKWGDRPLFGYKKQLAAAQQDYDNNERDYYDAQERFTNYRDQANKYRQKVIDAQSPEERQSEKNSNFRDGGDWWNRKNLSDI